MDVFTGVASNIISNVVGGPVIQLMKDVIHKEENNQILQADLKRMASLVLDIITIFQDQQKAPPQTVKDWLEELQKSLTEAKSLLHRSQARQRCLDCLMCNPARLSTQIREWKVSFDKLYQGLKDDFSTIVSAQQIAKSAPQKALLQDVPASGFVGSGINSTQTQVEMWLTEPGQLRIIGVYGMAGVEKTSCLKVVYNNYIKICFHIPPWRKHRYMQAKWVGSYKRTTNSGSTAAQGSFLQIPFSGITLKATLCDASVGDIDNSGADRNLSAKSKSIKEGNEQLGFRDRLLTRGQRDRYENKISGLATAFAEAGLMLFSPSNET